MTATISFIIPAFNESLHIGNTLRAINAACEKLTVCDVVVIDNESTDATREIAQNLGATVYTVADGPVSRLRNIGVANSSGEILIFIDADVSVTRLWSENIVTALEGLELNPNFVTGSHCASPDGSENIFERYWFSSFEHSASSHLGTGHLIMTRKLFDSVGGFSEFLETGEDYDICMKVKAVGGVVVENSALKVIHNDFPKTVRAFVAREAWHGSGDLSSLNHMLRSKVVGVTAIFLGLHFLIVGSIFFTKFAASLFFCFALLILLLAVSVKKFRGFGKKVIFINAYIYYWYFVGRSLALARCFLYRK